MRGDITKLFLETLTETAESAGDIFIAFLNAGYGASYGKLERELEEVKAKRVGQEIERTLREKFNRMSYVLKEDGLVEKKGRGTTATFSITKKGERKLKELRRKKMKSLPDTNYPKPEGDVVVLATFDVPEKERTKRAWLREALTNLGFSPVQQSVFVGRGRIPKQFMHDLYEIKIHEYVEIIEVGKLGTLTLKKLEKTGQ